MPAPARIEVVAGNAAGTWLDVTDELLIGRHADGLGSLGNDEEISRYHARVSLDPSGLCAIEDLGSTNGTFVNGLRLSVPKALRQGDTIELGGSTLVVRDLPAPSAADAPQPAPAAIDPATIAHEPEPEPEPVPAPIPPAAIPPLSVRVEIDFAANEASIALGDDTEPVRIVLESGSWRLAPPHTG